MKVLNAGLTEYNEALRILNDKLVAIRITNNHISAWRGLSSLSMISRWGCLRDTRSK